MSAVFKMYKNVLTKRPVLIQAVQAGVLMFTGDFIAQKFVEKKELHDVNFRRSLQFGTIGFCLSGPTVRIWYGILNKYIGSSGKVVAVKKVLLDQGIFAPTFIIVLLTSIGTMKGNDLDTTVTEIKRNYPDILVSNYFIWPWVQLGNFYFVPLQYQVLIVQVVALFWNTYLSWKTHRTHKVVSQERRDIDSRL